MEAAEIPVIVKLTPNITDITKPARAARSGRRGCDLADQHHQQHHPGQPRHDVPGAVCGRAQHARRLLRPGGEADRAEHGAECAATPQVGLPISGIGGISNWKDAAEFIALGSTSVQVCTAIMHYGFRIVEDMIDGLNDFLDEKGLTSVNDLRGKRGEEVNKWETLNLNYKRIASHQLRQVHRLQPVLHRLRGRRAPGHRR
jgi:dihydropyrimidine dehydrogenase (NAD+) subunit PreA